MDGISVYLYISIASPIYPIMHIFLSKFNILIYLNNRIYSRINVNRI